MDTGALVKVALTNWSFDPQIMLGLLLVAWLYLGGLRYSLERGLIRRVDRWRCAAFFMGVLAILIALESPIDYWGAELFWMHMLQHELLVMVAAPLLLLAAPAMALWRGVPLPARRVTLRWLLRQRWPRRLWHYVDKTVMAPVSVWLLFVVDFTVWHLPPLYDLALENDTIHILEHTLFLGTALLFWAQVILVSSRAGRLGYLQRALYLMLAALQGNVISAVLMFATTSLYPYYAALQRPPGMMGVVADQRWAGGVMDATGTTVFILAIILILLAWLKADAQAAEVEEQALRHRAVKAHGHAPVRQPLEGAIGLGNSATTPLRSTAEARDTIASELFQ